MNLVQEAYDYAQGQKSKTSSKADTSDAAGSGNHAKPVKESSRKKAAGKSSKGSNTTLPGAPAPPAYATTWWFAVVIGVIGGFATILTNSMGPMLNVYFLTLRMSPTTFVGTRSTFFTMVNLGKLVQRLSTGTLPVVVVVAAWKLMLLSVLGTAGATVGYTILF